METVLTKVVNEVNVTELMDTTEAVRSRPELGKFQFSISSRWLGGSHSRCEVNGFKGAGQEFQHAIKFELDAAEPPILLGNDEGPNPVEYLLNALAACVTTSMVYHAAARGIHVHAVESTVEGDCDLRGFLGIDPNIRNGFQQIRISMKVKADADERQWGLLKELGPTFSPVFDTVSNGAPIEIQTERIT
jgi:uncharacterized OsmC-like protein